ncbi:MAG TPA: globin [Limnochordia bacterium]|nr:globin [Limnochordia bacterium]
MSDVQTPYDQLGGAETIRALVEAFYPKVAADPDLAPIFPADLKPVKEKQYLFLTQFLGGPPLYNQLYGHPRLRARHLPHPVTPRRARAWLRCMAEALEQIELQPAHRTFLVQRLAAVAEHMINTADEPGS